MGWDISYMVEEMNCYWLDFDNQKTILEDGLECITIDTMALNKFEQFAKIATAIMKRR